ncbi:MAG TPA: acyl carrier protein [Gammaproteobacteria bacterium]|nr:acyl carrier protein [Gammaproteobacteria bacterium]
MTMKDMLRSYVLENYLFTDDPSALADADSFLDKGIIDSTGIMEIIAFLEVEFGIVVEDREMVPENLDSIASLVAFVERKRAAAES